jgi:hypothetical protein
MNHSMILVDICVVILLAWMGGALLREPPDPFIRIIGSACLIGAGMIIAVLVKERS